VTFPIFASRIELSKARWLLPGARLCALLCACALLLLPAAARADGAASSNEHLPELPPIPSLEVPRPTPEALAELDARLSRLCSADESERDAARRELLEIDPSAVPALRFRLASIADSTNHDELKELLLDVRKKGRDNARDEQAAEGKRGRVKTPDYLQMASEHASPKVKQWCSLISVLGASRMLAQIGTVEAVRGLIDVYVRYGEFLRVDTQLQLEALGDRAVPALIETRRHKAVKIAKWAERELDSLGKAIPSEAVQVTDLQVLSDVLRAFGRVRDPDAARIVVSFSNSERAQVREASRQAIAMLGEVGAWQLRDTYETVVGKKPARDWNWERTARELFGQFDRLRSAEVSKLYEAGAAAREHGDLEGMRKAFDQVLARNPDYPKRADLAQAYLDYAKQAAPKDPNAARSALRRVERLGKGSELEKTAASLRLTLEAEALAAAGIADRTLLTRALEADPNNARARTELARFEHGELKNDGASRYYAAGAIGLAALAGILVVLLRRGPREGAPASAGDSPAPGTSGSAPGEPPVATPAHAEPAHAEPAHANTAEPEPQKASEPAPAPAPSPAEPAHANTAEPEPQKASEPAPPIGEASSNRSEPKDP